MTFAKQNTNAFGKKKDSILQEVEKELREGAEDIDLVKVDALGLTSMIHEYGIETFDDSEYDVRDIVKSIIEKTSSLNSFFIIDIGAIFRRYKLWKKNLSRVEPFYAVKCNPDKVLLRTLANLGVGFDVASKEEISMVADFNVPRNMIIFANPVKESSHISYAESENVKMMTFDNEDELRKISHLNPKAKLVLRILVDDSKSAMPFGSKFGCPKQNLENVLSLAKTLELNIIGVSFHVGSGCTDSSAFSEAIINAREVFKQAEIYGFKMYLLDIGGGFPGYDASNDKFIAIANAINEQLEKSFSDIPDLRVIAEPGRFFATSCGILATNVIGRKIFTDNNGEKVVHYYINSNKYGMFNNIIFDKAAVEFNLVKKSITDDDEDNKLYKSVIFGQTCDSLDRIADDVLLPELVCGNWLFVADHGAYTLASASTFNGFEIADVKYVFTF